MASWVPVGLNRESSSGRRNRPLTDGVEPDEAVWPGATLAAMPDPHRGVAGARRRRHGPSEIRVLIVDDDRAYASALVLVLETDNVIQVVGIGHDGRDGIALASSLDPDVILMDVDMPHVDGIEAAREISASSGAEILMLSAAASSPRSARLARRAGASEFLHKAIDPFALIGYVHEAARRQRHRVDA